jgi:hypothetical protein
MKTGRNSSRRSRVYNLFISTFKPGESQWLDEIKRRVEYITQPQLNISTGQTFVPGSQVNLNLNWRNIKDVEFTLYNLDMTQAMSLSDFPNGINSYYDVMQRFRDNKGLMANLPVDAAMEAQHERRGQTYLSW